MYQTNSPCQYQKKCEEKSVEGFNNNVGCRGLMKNGSLLLKICTIYKGNFIIKGEYVLQSAQCHTSVSSSADFTYKLGI